MLRLRSAFVICVLVTTSLIVSQIDADLRVDVSNKKWNREKRDTSSEDHSPSSWGHEFGNPEEGEPFDEKIKTILRHLRNNSAGIPGVEIPDPMEVPDFEADISQSMMNAKAPLRNMTLTGLSAFSINCVETNLVKMETTIGLNFTELRVNGTYKLTGSLTFIRLSGEGDFWMTIKNAYVSGVIRLNISETGRFQVSEVDLDCIVQEINLNFENLFGGGMLSGVSNSLLNALSKTIFDSVKPSILEELSTTMTVALNEQFSQLPSQPLLVRGDGSPLDMAFINSAHQIKEHGLDPLELPDHHEVLDRQLVFFRFHGEVHVERGFLEGLSTLRRTGDITIAYTNNTIRVDASLGFAKLEGGYTWRANMMGIKRKGGIHFRITGLDIAAVVLQPNLYQSTPELSSFEIRDIGQIGLDVDGLGSLDFLLEFLGNFITNVFKKQLSEVVQKEIREIIQQNLREVNLPF